MLTKEIVDWDEYRATKEEIAAFTKAIKKQGAENQKDPTLDPMVRKLMKDSSMSRLDKLKWRLSEWTSVHGERPAAGLER